MASVRLSLLVGAVCLLLVPVTMAQPPVPKPGPEHEHLKALEGTWDAVVKVGGQESRGVAVYKMELGGLWLTSTFTGDFGGMKFEGKGIDGYDATKKKYVSLWVDSMDTTPIVSEGDYDKATKSVTMTAKGKGMDGQPATLKMVTQHKDNDHMVFIMGTVDKDGKDQVMMTIDYTRRK